MAHRSTGKYDHKERDRRGEGGRQTAGRQTEGNNQITRDGQRAARTGTHNSNT